jgi:ribosomal protein S18
MLKYQKVPKSTFCNFCKSVGHEDKDYRTLEMMKERIADTYKVQVEHVTGQMCINHSITLCKSHNTILTQQFVAQPQYNAQQFQGKQQYNPSQQCATPLQYNKTQPQYNQGPQYNTPCRDNQGNRGGFRGGGHGGRGFGGGRGPIVCHNYQKPGHYARDFPHPPATCMYCRATNHETKDFQHF